MTILRPRKLTQTHAAGCWLTCLAMLTGLPLELLEAFALPPTASERQFVQMYRQVNHYLSENGWRIAKLGPFQPAGYAIASGPTPEFGRHVEHSHVVRDGALWHDPSPLPIRVRRYTEYEVVLPLTAVDRTAIAPSYSRRRSSDRRTVR